MIQLERPACPHPVALANENYKHSLNKDALRVASNDKCMYCESKISHIDHAHVEHIKPKADGKFPELAFEWDNLGYACPKCNNNKSDKYHDECPYIDPYSENPSEYLYPFGTLLFQRNGSEKGEITIKDIKLNRPELIERRHDRIREIQRALDACFRTQNLALRESALHQLQEEGNRDKEYSIFVQAFLEANGEGHP